jgi:peroxiredoxin
VSRLLARRRFLATFGSLAVVYGARAVAGGDPFEALAMRRFPEPLEPRDFSVPMLDGRRLGLADLRGKVVLLNFWATWCPPCVTELPAMERLYQRHRAQGFTVLAVSLDSAGAPAVATFVREHALTFPIGLDAAWDVARVYGVRGLPTTALLDRQGRTVAMVVGPREWDGPDGAGLVAALLATR